MKVVGEAENGMKFLLVVSVFPINQEIGPSIGNK